MSFLTKSWEESERFVQQYLSKFFTPNLPSLRRGTVGLTVNFSRADPVRGQHKEVLGSVWGWGVSLLSGWYCWGERCGRQLLQKWGLLHKLACGFPHPIQLTLDPWWNHSGIFGLCTLKTKALSLLGISDKLRQSLQKHVLLIDCQNVWGFFP